MSKQSSVEYIIEMIRLNDKDFYATLLEDEVFSKAKVMHENDMKSFAIKAVSKAVNEDIVNPYNLDELYNETFNK